MKKFCLSIIILISLSTFSQYNFDISTKNPFGKYNPEAPKQLQDYQDLIGECNCTSQSRKPDGSWAKPIKMIWRWKYIMNGMAVQDETLKEDGKHSGSIRQFDTIKNQWNVHYYSSSGVASALPVWNGTRNNEGKIVLYKPQKSPNGAEGSSRLTFYDIDEKGYKWIGEWVDKAGTIEYAFWKINCTRETNN